MRVSAVFNHNQIITPGNFHQSIHIGGLSGKMNGNNGACAGCNGGSDFGGIDRSGSDPGGSGSIEILCGGGRRLIVRPGFDRQLLLDVIHTLESLA